MFYLFMQTLFWIIAAFVLGLIIGWWLSGRCCRENCNKNDDVEAKGVKDVKEAPTTAQPATGTVSDSWKPQGFMSAPADTDELKRIKGIGNVIEKTLNGLGIYTFQQISDFSDENIQWVENHLSFPGRIHREGWVSQAALLASGKTTEFSKRVDKGDVSYDS